MPFFRKIIFISSYTEKNNYFLLYELIQDKRKYTCFYKIIHFFMQFSTVEIRFIVTTLLYSTFANDLKRKSFFSKNVHSYTEYAALRGSNLIPTLLKRLGYKMLIPENTKNIS